MAVKSLEQPAAAVGLSRIAVSDTHGEDSPYFAGWKAYDENPYHEVSNPSGVIQMGLAENQVSPTTTSFLLIELLLDVSRMINPDFFFFFFFPFLGFV